MRVPVVSKDGKPLMPTKPAKATCLPSACQEDCRQAQAGDFVLRNLDLQF